MNGRRLAWLTGLMAGATVAAALIPIFPHYFYHWDEVQLRLGVDAFDLTWHRPHAPGYYVYEPQSGVRSG